MDRNQETAELRLHLDDEAAARAVQSVLRRLLRAATPDEVVSELVGLVHTFGGYTVPARLQDDATLPVDLSLGVLSEPLLAAAHPYSSARMHLEMHLPLVMEDARAVLVRLDQTARAEIDAAVDPLTGLLNRRGAARSHGAGRDGDAVVMIDLDNFKQLNDTQGHESGDVALRTFADVVHANVRESDLACRLGGDEFLLVLSATNLEACRRVLARIRQRWEEARPFPLTLSMGVAAVSQGNLDQAIAEADAALYRAKQAGRDRVEIATPVGSSS